MTEKEWKREFADNLRNMIRDSGLTRKNFCSLCGISHSMFVGYLKGKHTPSMKTLLKMAKVLDCYVDDLINFNEEIE